MHFWIRGIKSSADLSLCFALVPRSIYYKNCKQEEASPLLLQRTLVNNAVKEQNVPADCALAGIDVADKNNINVFFYPGHHGGGVCKKSVSAN